MQSNQKSTEEIVRQIIDVLSDGVSDLVLLVVVLREQNAPIPSTLPTASTSVNETAKKLGLIARKLASTDYKDFPEIAQEINTAAESLDQATVVLSKAVGVLSGTSDRQKGWNDLVDACRIMSGKTIRLLQIVYGAPLKRLKINADRLMDEINKFDTKPKNLHNQGGQKKLLDDLKPLTDKALRLEKHLNDRAKMADSPQAKKQLQDAANDVHKRAQDLVDAANDAINNPDRADLSRPLDDLRDAVEKGREISEKTAPPAPRGLPDSVMAPLGAPKPPTSKGPKGLHDEIEQAKQIAKSIPEIARKDPQRLPDTSDRLKDQVDQVRKKAHADPSDWDNVQKPLDNQIKAARDVQRNPNNPAAKKALDDATNNLIKALDDVDSKHGHGGPSAPRGKDAHPYDDFGNHPPHGLDPETKKQLQDHLGHIAPDMEKAISKPEHKEDLDRAKLKDNLQNLRDDVKHNHPKAAKQHLKQAVDAAKDLANDFRNDASDPYLSPDERRERKEAADDLEKAIPDFIASGNDALRDLNNKPAAGALEDQIRRVERLAEPPTSKEPPHGKVGKEEWNRAKDNMEKAIDAVKKGDKPATKKALEKSKEPFDHLDHGLLNRDPAGEKADDLSKLWDNFCDAADSGDPNIDNIIPEMEKAYHKYADVPKQAADRLQNALDNVVDAMRAGDSQLPISELEDAFDNFVNDVEKDPSPEVREAGVRAMDDLAPKIDDFIQKAQEAAKHPGDKRRVNVAESAVPPIKKAIQDFKNRIKPLDDNFEKAKDDMKKIANAARRGDGSDAKKGIENMADRPFGRNWKPNPNGRGLLPPSEPDGPSDELKKLWEKFRNAGNRGDPRAMEKLLPEMEKAYKKLTDRPKEAADKLKNAIDDVVDAVNAGRSDPPVDDLQRAFDKFINDTQTDPSPEVREAGKKAIEQARPKIHDLINKAKDASKNPRDKKKAQDVAAAGQQAKKPIDAFKDSIKPLDDAFDKNKNEMKKAVEAARRGDVPAVKRAIDNIAKNPYGRDIDALDEGVPIPLMPDTPADELDKLWNKLNDAADHGDAKSMDKIIPEIEKEFKKVSDKPKDDADKLIAAIDDVMDAVRSGHQDPLIDDLVDAYDKFVNDSLFDPSPEVREAARQAAEEAKPFIEELIKKADEAAKNPQDKTRAQEVAALAQQAKKPLENYKHKMKPLDDAFDKNKNEMKKAADFARRGDRGGAKKALDNIADKPFGRNFVPGKGKGVPPQTQLDGPSDELKKLWEKFKNACRDGDPQNMNRTFPEMERAYYKLSEKPKTTADKVKRAIDDLNNAIKSGNNPNPAINNLDKAMDDFQKLADLDPSPEVRDAADQALEELKPKVADLIRKAEDAANNPRDKAKAQAVDAAAQQAKRPLDSFKDKLRPLDQAFEKNKGEMKKAIEAVKRGDKPTAQKIIDSLDDKPFGRNLSPGKGRGVLVPDPAIGPSDELKDLFNKFTKAAKKGDPNTMSQIIPEMDKAFDDYTKASNAGPITTADKLEKAIDDVMNAIVSDDQLPLKELKDAYNDFLNESQNPNSSPETRDAALKAADDFKPHFVDFLKKAQDAKQNPTSEKFHAVENIVPKMKKPLKDFKAAIDPTQANDALINDKYGGDVKAAISDLKEAVNVRKPPEIKKAIEKVKDKLALYNDNAHDIAKSIDDPGKAHYIDSKADELDDILKKLADIDPARPIPDTILPIVEEIPVLIDDIVHHINSDPTQDAIDAAARAANMSAFLRSVDDDDIDLGDLLGCATNLADLMRGMIDNTSSVAEDLNASGELLTDAARSALDLNSLLREIETKGDFSMEDAQHLSEKVSAIRGSQMSSIDVPIVPLSEATTFEDITAAVAFNIRRQYDEQSESLSKTAANVASELANLSKAARAGNRKSMLEAARAASAHITALSKEVVVLAQKIQPKNPHERGIQDHLLKCSQGLINYGTQLKILTSVKAACIEESKDTDESLSILATDLGDIISQVLTSMSITNTTILRPKY